MARTLHGSALPHDYATEGIDRKCCAAGALGVPGMSGAVMVISGHTVVNRVSGTTDCSARTAADSWPHPGLVELLNVVNTTPRGRRGLSWLVSDVRRSMDVEMPIMLATFSVNCVNAVTCTQWSSPEPVIPQRNSATQPRRNRHEMICHAKSTAAGSSGPLAGRGGPRNTSLSGSTQRQGPLHSHFLGYLLNPGQPRPPGERKDQHRGLQTGEHPPEVSTPQCITERL